MSTTTMFRELADAELVSVETMHEFYDSLPPTTIEFLLGDWDGGVFRVGHEGEGQMAAFRWAGKTFHGRNEVDPIIARNDAGVREVSPIMGTASLRMVEHRGVSTATMIYDKHPIFDHFRKIDDNCVMGVMDRKGDAFPLFFYLKRL
jgi:hypothetical protein